MTVSRLLTLAAVIVFVLAALVGSVGQFTVVELIAAGLALFAAAHLV